MRDFKYIDGYLDKLGTEIYAQPQDRGHTALAWESINKFYRLMSHPKTVLDLGCGEGFCQRFFEFHNSEYIGVCLHEDYDVAVADGKNVLNIDFSFLPFEDSSYEFLYSRHSLEHSPMPLLTLMEWHRVTSRYLGIVLPAPEHWRYGGRNHYFVLNRRQWKVLFEVAGFKVSYEDVKRKRMAPDPEAPDSTIEYWYLLEKK